MGGKAVIIRRGNPSVAAADKIPAIAFKTYFLIKTGQTLNCYSSLVTTEEIVSEPVELIIVVVASVFVLSVKATNLC